MTLKRLNELKIKKTSEIREKLSFIINLMLKTEFELFFENLNNSILNKDELKPQRNGSYKRKIQTRYGYLYYDYPRIRNYKFASKIFSKHKVKLPELEELLTIILEMNPINQPELEGALRDFFTTKLSNEFYKKITPIITRYLMK
ncbi:transposase [Mycoplasmopsis anatis]|uniref:transposase n=1 Tax=Mycoplasmopsis anatis TaxID=171279 RepID=UPI001C4F5EF3|nr:transposase [Mycoplasmopsis anatis]MBW0596782.1 hypothetical protein [Mycoplasmopsis anatis]